MSQIRFAVVLVFVPFVASAQKPAPVFPILGLGVGATQLPTPLVEICGGNRRSMATIELLAGLTRGAFRVDARGALFHEGVVDACLSGEVGHESGVHTDPVYPYQRRHGDTSISAHAQYAPQNNPLMLGVGAGRLVSAKVPFFLASGALRTGGRLSAVLEAQARFTQLRYDLITSEWLNFHNARELARDEGRRWHRTFAIRLRAELRLR